MKIRHLGIVSLLALLTVFVMAFDVGPVFADDDGDDPSKRDAAGRKVDIGDHGGGDPDNPVPVDGGSEGEYRLGSDYISIIAEGDNLDLGNGWDSMVESYLAALMFLDSILLK